MAERAHAGMVQSLCTFEGSEESPSPPVGSVANLPPAIVIGSGVTALGTLRSLARARIQTFYLPEKLGLACRSRWARPLPGAGPLLAPRVPLEDALGSTEIEEGILIACSDSSARRVASLSSALAKRFRPTGPEPDVLETFIDKRRFAAFLRREALPHPLTVELESEEDLESLEPSAFESAFLKPRDSQRFFSRYGVKACRVDDRDHAVRLLRKFNADGLSVVLQEYVPGPASSHLFLDGFIDRKGSLTHLLCRRRLRMYPTDFGNSTICETVPSASVAPAITSLRRALARSGYRGMFSAEMKQDPRDGVFKFLEVNARAWWYVGFAGQCGVNVCEAAYLDGLGLDVHPAVEPKAGVRLVYPSYDFAAFRHERRRAGRREGVPSTGDWFGPWIGAKQPIWALGDLGPALWSLAQWLPERLKKVVTP